MKCYRESNSCTVLMSIFPSFDYQISVSLAKKLLRNFSLEYKNHFDIEETFEHKTTKSVS